MAVTVLIKKNRKPLYKIFIPILAHFTRNRLLVKLQSAHYIMNNLLKMLYVINFDKWAQRGIKMVRF